MSLSIHNIKNMKKESEITKLNCGVGNLAITVTCLNPENLGNIVEILKPVGFKRWNNIAEQVFTWEVLAVGENSWLMYEIEGCPVTKKVGFVSDLCLRRITPPKNKKTRMIFLNRGI